MLNKLKSIIKSPKFPPLFIFTLGLIVFSSVAIYQLVIKNKRQSETIEITKEEEGEVAGFEVNDEPTPYKKPTPTTKKFIPTKTPTPSPTNTPTSSPSPTQEPTNTPTSTPTPSPTSTPTSTPTPTETATPSATPT